MVTRITDVLLENPNFNNNMAQDFVKLLWDYNNNKLKSVRMIIIKILPKGKHIVNELSPKSHYHQNA